MRNLDIVDTRDKLLDVREPGVLPEGQESALPRLLENERRESEKD